MMLCTKCGKRLSRKTARLIDGKILCSACLFPPMKREPQQQDDAA